MKRILTFALFVFITLNTFSKSKDAKNYLRVVLKSLNNVESATYFSTSEGLAPGDVAPSTFMNNFVKEYNNPGDTTIGASFVKLLQKDTTQMDFCYDGKMRAIVNNENKTICIDSFKVRNFPFRPLAPPFFNYTKSIIKYALETKDSISIKTEETQHTAYLCLTIFEDRQVEFFGKAFYIEVPSWMNIDKTTSKYELWFDKSTDLPYRCRREMSHNISVETISDVFINKLKIENFKASNYFMPDFAVTTYGNGNKPKEANVLTGTTAPGWVLQDANNDSIALKDLKSKVIIIQFTSVSCGPCRASIPFLNRLTASYKKDDLDLVAIECTSGGFDALKNYQNKTGIKYKFLKSTKSILQKYNIRSYPAFFILDKDLIIRKVINGYGIGSTDKEITDIVDKMIH